MTAQAETTQNTVLDPSHGASLNGATASTYSTRSAYSSAQQQGGWALYPLPCHNLASDWSLSLFPKPQSRIFNLRIPLPSAEKIPHHASHARIILPSPPPSQMSVFFTLVSLILINLAIGLLPYIDNFAHMGGLIAGFLLGFILLPRPQPHYFDLRSSSAVAQAAAVAAAGGHPVTKKFTSLQTWLRVGAALVFVGL